MVQVGVEQSSGLLKGEVGALVGHFVTLAQQGENVAVELGDGFLSGPVLALGGGDGVAVAHRPVAYCILIGIENNGVSKGSAAALPVSDELGALSADGHGLNAGVCRLEDDHLGGGHSGTHLCGDGVQAGGVAGNNAVRADGSSGAVLRAVVDDVAGQGDADVDLGALINIVISLAEGKVDGNGAVLDVGYVFGADVAVAAVVLDLVPVTDGVNDDHLCAVAHGAQHVGIDVSRSAHVEGGVALDGTVLDLAGVGAVVGGDRFGNILRAAGHDVSGSGAAGGSGGNEYLNAVVVGDVTLGSGRGSSGCSCSCGGILCGGCTVGNGGGGVGRGGSRGCSGGRAGSAQVTCLDVAADHGVHDAVPQLTLAVGTVAENDHGGAAAEGGHERIIFARARAHLNAVVGDGDRHVGRNGNTGICGGGGRCGRGGAGAGGHLDGAAGGRGGGRLGGGGRGGLGGHV